MFHQGNWSLNAYNNRHDGRPAALVGTLSWEAGSGGGPHTDTGGRWLGVVLDVQVGRRCGGKALWFNCWYDIGAPVANGSIYSSAFSVLHGVLGVQFQAADVVGLLSATSKLVLCLPGWVPGKPSLWLSSKLISCCCACCALWPARAF